jgi:hypothetical protein
MREHWREVRAGRRPHPDQVARERHFAEASEPNPLFDLPEQDRAELFAWLRECPFWDAVLTMLGDKDLGHVTKEQVNEFFQEEAVAHWQVRMERAAMEADAVVRLVEDHVPKFSAGILAALGQEAFRQVSKGDVDPESMGKFAKLFMAARSAERADQMQELRRTKLRHELEDLVEQALQELAEEVERHPAAREAFEALRRELAEHQEEA